MDTFRNDLRTAVRGLARAPGFTLLAVATLAVGIGATTALFSVVDAVLLRRLPYADPATLVAVWPQAGHAKGGYALYREHARAMGPVEAYRAEGSFVVTGRGDAARVDGAEITPGMLALLGVRPALGPGLAPGDGDAGAPRRVVLSDGLWRERFAASPDALGQTLEVDGVPHVVAGVMPPGFAFPSRDARLWVPVRMDAADVGSYWGDWGYRLVARIRPETGAAAASADVRRMAALVRAENPLWTLPAEFGSDAAVVPLQESMVGDARPLLVVLLAAVAAVLLIAVVNVANLLLARGARRAREMAIRAAVGAGRARLARLLLTESLVLAACGGVAGVLLAYWGLAALVAWLPAGTPRLGEAAIDGRVLAVTAAVTLATAVGVGLLPALGASRMALNAALAEGGRGGTGARQRAGSRALVVSQVALAVVLVTAAGLLVRSFLALTAVDPGFRGDRVVSARLSAPAAAYGDDAAKRRLVDEVLRRLGETPGVTAVAAASEAPLAGTPRQMAHRVEGRTPDPNVLPSSPFQQVTPGWFRALGVPLLAGRDFAATDGPDAPVVAVVSRSFAARWWPGEDPVGKRIGYPWASPWITVVGVVGDVRHEGLARGDGSGFYLALAQRPEAAVTVVARTAGAPGPAAAALRAAVAAADRDVAVGDVRTLEEVVDASVAGPRATMLLLGAFAAAALLLGAVGVYGVLAQSVSQRTREIGVRMALGARGGDVLRLVLGEGGRMAAAGVVLGLAGALGATRLLRSLLFGVEAWDAATFLAVPPLLLAVSLLAAWVPARRAARVDPMQVLRGE